MNFIQMDWKPVCEQLTSVQLNEIVLFDISLIDVASYLYLLSNVT